MLLLPTVVGLLRHTDLLHRLRDGLAPTQLDFDLSERRDNDLLAEIERLLSAAADVTIDAAARPRLGAISFVHRFGSALNRHVHLHVCATDGVFVPAAGGAGCCAPPAFLPARPITQTDLATSPSECGAA